ncbi:MAG: DUF2264 domain-containing protein [Clostridia bacterium]|nr:DUF2264 domain-containing protein [Clostridia bacterium]
MSNQVKDNPLLTRADVELAAVQLIEPLLPLLSEGKARLRLGETGAAYDADIAEMEGFARPLWAIVPMLAGGCEKVKPLWDAWKQGIENGVDPSHPEYWGEIGSYDQRQVEMAVFGYGMAIAPQEFFFSLSREGQTNLYRWLDQINHTELFHNNWMYFRVLVNIGFMICGLPHNQTRLENDFAALETHYLGDGWYQDLPGQLDYYTPWAFHYYSLIYAKAMKERDAARSALLLDRAKAIAPDIACWFDANGEAIPYGRSLTYRFAQSAFFGAMALAEGECDALPYGRMKHLLLSNLRSWMKKPIFTRDGVLTIGYGYPNLLMGEGYNAPGSPYWAMKAFACLALGQEHPFWTSKEEAYPAPALMLQKHMRMLIARDEANQHVIAYPAGNCCEAHAHCDAKYEKFAYSTVFGFSVPKTQRHLAGGAFDSMLAFSEEEVSWFTRYQAKEYELREDSVVSLWRPLAGVKVRTQIIPAGNWHLRIHEIETNRWLYAAEGGFAMENGREAVAACEEKQAMVSAPWGVSAIRALRGYDRSEVVKPEPNTNLMKPRTLLPTLRAHLAPGRHVLCCVVYGSPSPKTEEAAQIPAMLLQALDNGGKNK